MAATSIDCRESLLARRLRRVRRLLRRRAFDAALASTRRLLWQGAQDPQALYVLALAQRCAGELTEALATLDRLEILQPRSGRLFQERGRCRRALGDGLAAVRCFQRAVTLNPTLVVSWRALIAFHEARGHTRHAALARRHLLRIERLPVPVRRATGRLAEGDFTSAERILHDFLRSAPQQPDALILLARLSGVMGALEDAQFLLSKALTFAPDHTAARYAHALVLARRGQHAQALAAMRSLLALEPADRSGQALYTGIGLAPGQADEVAGTYRSMLREEPAAPELHLAIGHALIAGGHRTQAVEAYRSAALIRPSFGEAYWSLAERCLYRFSREEVTRMWAEEASPEVSAVDRYHLCFALGRALEERGEYELAFGYYARGNRLKRAMVSYDPRAQERCLRTLAHRYSRHLFAARTGADCTLSGPIFIVGLPHAGAGLIEQMLAGHSCIDGMGARSDIERLEQRLSAAAGGRSFDPLQAAELARIGEQCLATVATYRTGRTYFMDSTLANFRHLGLIRLILPRAKIIDVRREPMACCLDNFRQLFACGGEFSYSLQDIGRYYRAYTALMRHWDELLPGWILHVRHEDLIADPEAAVRRILEFIGLAFEPACLPWRAPRRSARAETLPRRTAPSAVRERCAWSHFEPWLRELKTILGESLVR